MRKHIWTIVTFVGVTFVIAVCAGSAMGKMFTQADVTHYLDIARGNTSNVLQPFSSRQLGPLTARALAHVLRIDILNAFIIEGIVSLLCLLVAVALLLIRGGANRYMLLAVGGIALWPFLFNGLAMPDLFFGALLGIFLLLLVMKQDLACALMFVPLWMSREASILVLVSFLIVAWRRLRPRHFVVSFASTMVGIGIVRLLIAGGPGNKEKLSFLLYMTGKVPWNFLKNVLGILPWTNVKTDFCTVPAWQVTLHLDRINAVGICGWDPMVPVYVLRLALASFGILPVLFVYLAKRDRKILWPDDPMLRFCILYGLLSILLAPVMGSWMIRYFYYAWPLFAIAVPIMAMRHLKIKIPPGTAAELLLAHVGIAWTPVLAHSEPLSTIAEIGIVITTCALYVRAWVVLTRAQPLAVARDLVSI